MGLAETKRKKKFAPSNFGPSAWSNAAPTSSVGFKLMSSMGWAPGQGLGNDLQGQKDSVKYALKDDLLGIGAKKEYGGGLWRGTREVDDLYRRLEVGGNKATEEVVEVKEEIKEVKKVRSGWQMKFQVGDIYTSSFSQEGSEVEGTNSAVESSGESSGENKSKKRKREDEDGKKKKEEWKEEKSGQNKDNPDLKKEEDQRLDKVSKRQKFKEKAREEKLKRKMEKKARNQLTDSKGIGIANSTIAVSPGSKKDKKSKDKDKKEQAKEEKKEGKERKNEEKERKTDKESSSKKKRKDKSTGSKDTEVAPSKANPSTLEPVAETIETLTETTIPRHMHRARFMAMKRASVMDQRALREILGVKE